jgi:hypothetical protein
MPVYFSVLKKDPIYLFTRGSATDYLSIFFEQAFLPLLLHMQEQYGSIIRLDNIPTTPYSSRTKQDEIQFKAPNFRYISVSKFQIYGSEEYQMTQKVTIPPIELKLNPGYNAMLTVSVPKNLNHPFWNRNSREYLGYSSNETKPNTVDFRVTKWGPTIEQAQYHATQRAMDIIRNIRRRVRLSPVEIPSRQWKENHSEKLLSCPIYNLANQLHKRWGDNKPIYSQQTSSKSEFWLSTIKELESLSLKLPSIGHLLEYYQVIPPNN